MSVDQELFGDRLPTYLTRFVGRDRECAQLVSLLAAGPVVTICGVGGAGKTRLAVELARMIRAEDGRRVCWAPLVATADAGEIRPVVARGVGLSASATLVQLAAALRAEPTLLVLDNCEQLAEACGKFLSRLLPNCPDLRVLASSRVPLGLSGEQIYAVPALGAAIGDDEGRPGEPLLLFADRAADIASGYAVTELNRAVLTDICQNLQGSPLAIELAASWIRVLSPRDLLDSLQQAPMAIGPDAPGFVEERHRSLTAVLDSSWQWLTDADRSAIEALGVFVGGFTRPAAAAVADADLGTLSRLSQLALIQRLPDPYGGSRYQIHELVRSYALHRLADPAPVRDRHRRYFLDLVELSGPDRHTVEEPEWSDPVIADLANVDAALAWALAQRDPVSAQGLALGLDHFGIFCLHSYEHRVGRLDAALALPPSDDGEPDTRRIAARVRAQALLKRGERFFATDPGRSNPRFAEALGLFRRIGDEAGVAACIRARGNVRMLQGDYPGSRTDCLDSLAQVPGVRRCSGGRLVVGDPAARSALLAGDSDQAVERLSQAAADFSERDSSLGACYSEIELALAHQLRSEWARSADACARSLQHQRRHRLTATSADLLEVVARLCAELGRWIPAAELYGAAASWHEEFDAASWFPLVSRFSLAPTVRRQLGELGWQEAFETGRQYDPDHADRVIGERLTELRSMLDTEPAGLSQREVEVLRLVAEGLSDAEIANRLVLSPRSIHAHLALGVHQTGCHLTDGSGARGGPPPCGVIER